MVIFSFILYYLIILPVSLLPLRVLYVLSDFLYVIFYKVIGFRQKVVRQNLIQSFPDHSHAEILSIEKAFYHHLCDLIIEAIKAFTLSRSAIPIRMKATNPELLDPFFEKGQNVLLAGGHLNNWEWFASALPPQIKHSAYALYRPLRNRFFDVKMKISRGRNGLTLISTRDAGPFFNSPPDMPFAMIFGIDQSPLNPRKCHWMTFLNQDTGVMFGLEKYSRQINCPVVYTKLSKLKRGYYEMTFSLVTDDPASMPANSIIELATRKLEADILESPAYWLWTHRRWKRKRPADMMEQTQA